MDLNRYLSEAELAISQPVAGDEFDISINEVFNLETEVLESNEDGIVLAMDDHGLSMLEQLGLLDEAEGQNSPMKADRDFDLIRGVEYKGFALGAEDHSDDDVRKTSYSVYKPLGDGMYEFYLDVKDPKYGGQHSISPYSPKDIEGAFKYTVDGLLSGQFKKWVIPRVSLSKEDIEASETPIIEDVVKHATHGAVYGKDGKAKLFMTRNEAEEVADAMAAKHGGSGISIVQGPFTGYMVKMPETMLEAMPSSVIKDKQKFSEMSPEELHAYFVKLKDYADSQPAHPFKGKGIEEIARRKAWSHGYGNMSGHYWDKIKTFESQQTDEAEYQGHSVQLGKPSRGDVKKYKVYVRDPKSGNIKKVNFGDKNMEIKRDNPARRKNFRARHNCADKKDRTKAGYWSCRMWSKKPVSKIV